MNYLSRIFAAIAAFALIVPASGSVVYVDGNGTHPVPPYNDWSTAATNIQDAVTAAAPGDVVLVTNGLYQTGGMPTATSGMSNRVAVFKPVTVQSVNGPALTLISGNQVPGTTNGGAAIRCVYLTNGAALVGFTLTNGATLTVGPGSASLSAGGVWCDSTNAMLSNCVVVACSGMAFGGGAFRGTLVNCTLVTNSNFGHGAGAVFGGGGANSSFLIHCFVAGNYVTDFGGGAVSSTLVDCTLAGNQAGGNGGGVYGGSMFSCLVYGNAATNGGGMYMTGSSKLIDSTLVGNSALSTGGGVWGNSGINNCIVYYNTAPVGTNWFGIGMNYTCTVPIIPLANNITNEPLFVNLSGGDFHLQPNSPCINSGNNGLVMNSSDLDGNPRIRGGTVDMGAYEFQAQVTNTFLAWLQQYGLPTDGSADFSDPDGDGCNNCQEWIAGTSPIDAASVLKLLAPVSSASPPGLTVNWQSVNTRMYYLQSGAHLNGQPAFVTLQSNIVGQVGTTGFIDTNAVGPGPVFYRVGVQ